MQADIPILGFSAWSGTGKTTLLRRLIPALKARGLRVSVIKHAHHHFDLDFPGKDSYELRKAGADQTVICTTTRMAMITEFEHPGEEPDLQQIIASLDTSRVDMILVEGYKDIHFPKIELHRAEHNRAGLRRHSAGRHRNSCIRYQRRRVGRRFHIRRLLSRWPKFLTIPVHWPEPVDDDRVQA
jgi:molybdopterin-guanine dinucleotide biosynthesis protein MobB